MKNMVGEFYKRLCYNLIIYIENEIQNIYSFIDAKLLQ